MLIICVTKQAWILEEKKSPIVDLIQHKIGGIIGSFQERNLAATSRKD